MLKKMINDSIWVYLTQIISLAIPLYLLFHLTAHLSFSTFGEYSFALSLASITVLLQNLGISQYGIERIKKKRISDEFVYIELVQFKLVNFLLIFLTIVVFIPQSKFLLLFTVPLLNCFSTDWIYQAKNKPKDYALFNLFFYVTFALLIGALIQSDDDVIILNVIYFFHSLTLHIYTYKRLNLNLKFLQIFKLNKIVLLQMWGNARSHVNVGLLSSMKSYSGVFVYGLLAGAEAVGVVAVMERIMSIANSFSIVINRVIYPTFLNLDKLRVKQYILNILAMLFLFLIILYISTPPLIEYVLKDSYGVFKQTELLTAAVLISVISIASSFIGYPYLGVMNRIDLIYKSTIIPLMIYSFFVLIFYFTECDDMRFFVLGWLSIFVIELLCRLYLFFKIDVRTA